MTTISDNTLPPALLDTMSPKTDAAKSGAAAAQDRFMTLLVTQMKNQDPLNPLDNAQVTSQLAQLSTVTGIDKLNSTLESLMGNYQAAQSMQAANLIGHGVLAPGSGVDLVKGSALMGMELKGPADDVQVTIRDASGKEVRTLHLGAQNIGTVPFGWDGKAADGSSAADGSYKFEIKATLGGDKVEVDALQFSVVTSVQTGAQGPRLSLPNMGTVNFADVRQIL
jgi:flagellar basal-body rod modification protein FlgD